MNEPLEKLGITSATASTADSAITFITPRPFCRANRLAAHLWGVFPKPLMVGRVATLVLGHDGDNRSFSQIGILEGHHDLSHHQNKDERIAKVAKIDQWYAQQFAKFVQKLHDTKDADGKSLLHNSMIVYGSGNADGNRHTHSNLPLILAGASGGVLKPGRYVKHGSKPTTNLFLTMADRMGVQGLERFGDSTGRLANL